VYVKTFDTPIPDDATGTWTFTADVRRTVVIDDGSDDGLEVTEAAFNPIFHAAVTADEAEPRREVVAVDNCNRCHDVLALHGGQRLNVQSAWRATVELRDVSRQPPEERRPGRSTCST
jgi:hypothetical protein